MAKIQITTVEMKSNAQVIVLDANFVSRVVRSFMEIQQLYGRCGCEQTVSTPAVYSMTESAYGLLGSIICAFEGKDDKMYERVDIPVEPRIAKKTDKSPI